MSNAIPTSDGQQDPTGGGRGQPELLQPEAYVQSSPATGVVGLIRQEATANQQITADSLDRLADVAERTVDAVGDLSASLVEYQKWGKLTRLRFNIIAGFAVLTLLILSVGTVVQQRQNADRRERIIATQERIVSCTDPGGACFKRAQAATATAVLSINEVSILAAVCAPDYVKLPIAPRTIAMRKCIAQGLAK